MSDYVEVPSMLLNKIKRVCPDIFQLLKLLGEARTAGDTAKQKSIRSILRKKGFYLSRLQIGEDPFVHWSLCNGEGMDSEECSNENLMTENDVVLQMVKWLEKCGWEIITQCLDHQHGIDILAIKHSQTLIVEAKGAKGSKVSHVTIRERFSSGQIKSHFGRALVKCLEERNRNLGAQVAIAQPNNIFLRNCLSHVSPEAIKIGVHLYWVSEDGTVEREL